MSKNSSDDKNDFNYQQELSKFLHTGCSKPTGCRIMIVEKPNLILEARYCGKLVGEICNFFTPFHVFATFTVEYLTPLYTTWISNLVCMLRVNGAKRMRNVELAEKLCPVTDILSITFR